jgi:uncharacterized protein
VLRKYLLAKEGVQLKKWDLYQESKSIQLIASLVFAFIGGGFFTLIHLPIPWLLGPMTALLIASRFKKMKLIWPRSIRDTGLMIVGYSIGISLTKDSLFEMAGHLPSMLLMTSLTVAVCAGLAFIISKLGGIDYPTALTSSIPGGLSQIVTFAEEMEEIDMTTVTFFQVIRVLMVIFFVPLLVFGPLFTKDGSHALSEVMNASVPQSEPLFPTIILFAFVCILGALIGKKIKLPAPFFLGSIIAAAALSISGVEGPPLSSSILDLAQFMVGGYIGLLLKPEQLDNKKKIISLAVTSSLILILTTLAFSFLLTRYYDFSSITSFLSVAPGGMDQMGIIAHEVHADLSTVTSYQLFRIIFIYVVVPPMLRIVLKYSLRKKSNPSIKFKAK